MFEGRLFQIGGADEPSILTYIYENFYLRPERRRL